MMRCIGKVKAGGIDVDGVDGAWACLLRLAPAAGPCVCRTTPWLDCTGCSFNIVKVVVVV